MRMMNYFFRLVVTGCCFWVVVYFVYWNIDYNQFEMRREWRPRVKRSSFFHFIKNPTLAPVVNNPNMIGIIRSPEDQKTLDLGYKMHAFNTLISDRLGFHRYIPDTRNKLCKDRKYLINLLKASVIICFYNEAWSTLLRTVYSVLDRTPANLLHEIILVDDFSNYAYLKRLKIYMAEHLPQVKLIKAAVRQGLIRARMLGASKATGDVLVFLDSHCEPNVKWLEPLLARIAEDRHNVAVPIIDMINTDTFEYEVSPLVRGGFNWGLSFRWDQLPERYRNNPQSLANPIESPTMAGGLFAMDRDYFNELGQYDPGMDIWGGENLEISFRIWQCGGRLEIIPCSRVGHVFRKRRPYGSLNDVDTTMKNSLRVAHVWMDEYKKYYFKQRPNALTTSYGNISDRLDLRKRLRCKSFRWYLANVYPEQVFPDEKGRVPPVLGNPDLWKKWKKPKIVHRGLLQHTETALCVEVEGDIFSKKALLYLRECHPGDEKQMWCQSSNHEFLLSNVLCLDIQNSAAGKNYPRLMKCHGSKGSQEWVWSTQTGNSQLYNAATGKCLSVETKENEFLAVDICDESRKELQFKFI